MNPPPLHHPSEDLLLRHAAGRLPFGQALVVATHLPFCPACRSDLRLAEAVGGALLAALPPTELAPDALARTLARLDMTASAMPPALETVVLAAGVTLPDTLRGLVKSDWGWLAPGVSRIAIEVPAGEVDQQVSLLRVAPGGHLPKHRHTGWELTCVLAGGFTDVTGAYGPGDLAELDADTRHQPVAAAGEACICLIAWEGRLRLRGLARLARPLTGI